MKSNLRLTPLLLLMLSCSCEENKTTGWNYSEPAENGGFDKVPYQDQDTGQILIEGANYTMGHSLEK